MPALRVFGRAFHIASDDVPLFALGGAIFHLFWIVAIAITARNILDMPDICKGDAGLYYIGTVASLLVCFAAGFILELLLMWQGCQGVLFLLFASAHTGTVESVKLTLLIAVHTKQAKCDYALQGVSLSHPSGKACKHCWPCALATSCARC